MAKPSLGGVRVLDFTQALAGPYCTMLLADFGADVIKIEVPGRGDDTRYWGPPFIGDESAYFLSINRNKRSICLNLKNDEGRQAAHDLVATADVVVENFRPGTASRLGLGAEELRTKKPELVYCSISGYGQGGSARAGYDQIIQGSAGLMSITGMPDGPPTKVGVPISDIAAGMFATQAILAALFARERTGEGSYIDVALQDAVIALLTFQAGRYFATGVPPGREGNHHPTIAPYGTFKTQDGYVNIAVGNDTQWARFCAALGNGTLADDPWFRSNMDRLSARERLHASIEPILLTRTTDEWLKLLEDEGVPAGPILSLDQVFADPGVKARDMRMVVDHPRLDEVSLTGVPWKFDGALAGARHPPPLLGQHTEEVLRDILHYPAEKGKRLLQEQEAAAKPWLEDQRHEGRNRPRP